MVGRALGRPAVVIGVGESTYYKRGQSPDGEFQMALRAILAAANDAGIDPTEIDGFSSFSNDRTDPGRLASALGLRELNLATMVWGGGGGGGSAAVANAAHAITVGAANCVVVFRSLAQSAGGRFGQPRRSSLDVYGAGAFTMPYGLISPAHSFAMRVQRAMYEFGVSAGALRAIALASYRHAQANPRALMRGHVLDEEIYDASRWIVEPFRLYDCCMENDGAAAIIVASEEQAAKLARPPVYVAAGGQGSDFRQSASIHNAPEYASANFKTASSRLFERAGISPKDVDVLQSYENFTGGVVMSLVESGFCSYESVNTYCTLDNLSAPLGGLPLNTSGGNLAECYVHGLELIVEAVRQVRIESTSQVPDVHVSMVTSGPMVSPVSGVIFTDRQF